LQELGLPELTTEQVEQLCMIAETAAKRLILSKVPAKKIETLNISAEATGAKPFNLAVEVEIVLSPEMEGFSIKELSDEAVRQAFISAENFLRELACHSQK
jgi:hypothetical protein